MRKHLLVSVAVAVATATALTASSSSAHAAAPDEGAYKIKVLHSQKCLDVASSPAGAGATIVQNTCAGKNTQRFTLVKVLDHEPFYRIKTAAGLCWTRDGAEKTNDLVIRQQTCTTDFRQLFRIHALHKFDDVEYQAVYTTRHPALVDKCLHVYAVDYSDNVDLITYDCNDPSTGYKNDAFTFVPA
ncbi:RICIN domain-containing protein [Rhizohabitans arisaemae]|uniref:RICIN domain-containing protein n=1 Tax=Rhizohabitans arisaemae TaxID=2720610 RepID=UPI0024B12226|nr:RICIN domain-containing protein [Rhizohabitans arisaemae]